MSAIPENIPDNFSINVRSNGAQRFQNFMPFWSWKSGSQGQQRDVIPPPIRYSFLQSLFQALVLAYIARMLQRSVISRDQEMFATVTYHAIVQTLHFVDVVVISNKPDSPWCPTMKGNYIAICYLGIARSSHQAFLFEHTNTLSGSISARFFSISPLGLPLK